MAVRAKISGSAMMAGALVGVIVSTTAAAQSSEVTVQEAPSLRSNESPIPASPPKIMVEEAPSLRRNEGMVTLDYQVLRVKGDQPIDLMGFHVYNKVSDRLYLGAGMYAPLYKGAYGGFALYDFAAHFKQPLTPQIFATAGLAVGGGAGGRSVANAKALSGSGGFVKAYVGLGYDFGAFSLGANVTRMKLKGSAIDSTQANVFLEVPYTYLTGSSSSHGQRLSAADARQANEASGEHMLSVTLDNFKQQNPQGTFKGAFNTVDLQYSQFFTADSYWFTSVGVGYKGLPVSNQLMGGVGRRVRVSPRLALYGQLGIGSGLYAPEIIDTGSGLLVYPKVSVEYGLTKNLGLSLSAGYLVAPRGTSKNPSFGIALTRHLGVGDGSSGRSNNSESGLTYQAFRLGLFHQTDFGVSYRNLKTSQGGMIGIQVDTIINDHFYIPLQAAAAYTSYLGNPGNGEFFAGIGLQSRAKGTDRWQTFGQLMAGSNGYGIAAKGIAGVRYILNDRIALSIKAGHSVAKSASGGRYAASSLALGLDYSFSVPSF